MNTAKEIMLRVYWDLRGIDSLEFLKRSVPLNAHLYVRQMECVRKRLV